MGICVCTTRYGTWRMVNRDRCVTDMDELRVISIWSTQIRKPPATLGLFAPIQSRLQSFGFVLFPRTPFFPVNDCQDVFLFVISIHSHCYYSFASLSLQLGGLIWNQISQNAKDGVESRTGSFRKIDGNLLRQRKGIYQQVLPRKATSKIGLWSTTDIKGFWRGNH